ncbi:ribosomal protein S5 domain 2-type protein [Chytridium lagenaria]|nr:ribosomal protein S5 domain 2-type protein [Chytridium lagenaria]
MAPSARKHVLVRAPGKVILFGEHAVVYGKKALAASLGLHTYTCIKRQSDYDGLEFNFPDVELKMKLSADYLSSLSYETRASLEPTTFTDAHKKSLAGSVENSTSEGAKQAAYAALHLFLCIVPKNSKVSVEVRSFIPVGSGMGSSASFSVCLAAGFLVYSGKISYDKWGRLSKEDLDLVNRWAFVSEQILHGNPSGIDNTICTFDFISRLILLKGGASSYVKGEDMKPVEGLSSLEFLLTNTMVPKNTKVQVEKVREKLNKFPLIIGNVLQAIDGISQSCMDIFSDKVSCLTVHFFHGVFLKCKQSLIEMNHELLSVCGVSHPEIEKVRRIASLFGFVSKLTGAGGGGCVLTFIGKVKWQR